MSLIKYHHTQHQRRKEMLCFLCFCWHSAKVPLEHCTNIIGRDAVMKDCTEIQASLGSTVGEVFSMPSECRENN